MASSVASSTAEIIKRFEQPSRVISGLNSPGPIAVNSKGHIVTADDAGCHVSVLTSAGEKIHSFGSEGSGDGQFMYAYGITVDKDDNIYTIENGNDRVQKFSPEGKFLGKVGHTGESELQFSLPIEIKYNHIDSLLYIADQENGRIQVLTTDLKFVRNIGKSDSTSLATSAGIAYDSANMIYTTDFTYNSVFVLSTTGEFKKRFGDKPDNTEVDSPTKIVVDSNLVIVVDNGHDCISIFSLQGEFITSFKEGILCPGLALDKNNTLYVCDIKSNQIFVYN